MNRFLFIIIAACCLIGCGRPQIPTEGVTEKGDIPVIYPDYTGLVIPPNIAPLNFEIGLPGESYITRISSPAGKELVAEGNTILVNKSPSPRDRA